MGYGCALCHVNIDFLVTIKNMINHTYVKGNSWKQNCPNYPQMLGQECMMLTHSVQFSSFCRFQKSAGLFLQSKGDSSDTNN